MFKTDPGTNFSRSALLEANGSIYVALASHCDQQGATTHGWMVSYSAKDLTKTADILNTTAAQDDNGDYFGSPWMSGYGPAADEKGNVYFATGNGATTIPSGFAMSVIKVPGNLDLNQADYFQPPTALADSDGDHDLGSGGVMLLPLPQQGASPAPHLLVQGGKCQHEGPPPPTRCMKYILNRDSMRVPLWQADVGGDMYGGPAYFFGSDGKPHVVYGGENNLTTYTLQLPAVKLVPQSVATSPPGELPEARPRRCFECRTPGGSQPVVSSNGSADAIVWAVQTPDGNRFVKAKRSSGNITLFALDALHMNNTLYSGKAGVWTMYVPAKGPLPDWIGAAFVSPLIADGRVYVPTDGALAVFGLGPVRPGARIVPALAASVTSRYSALLAVEKPAAAQPAKLLGTIASITGSTFVLRPDTGSQRTVDPARAIKSGYYSALFVGKRVLVTGSIRADGTFDAATVTRITDVYGGAPNR